MRCPSSERCSLKNAENFNWDIIKWLNPNDVSVGMGARMLQLSNIVRYASDTRNVQPFSGLKTQPFHLHSQNKVKLLRSKHLVHFSPERKTEQLISTDGLVKMLMKCVWMVRYEGGKGKRWMHCMDAGSPSSLLIWTCELSNQNGLQICYEAVELRSMAKIISLHSSSWFLFAHGKKSTQFLWYTKPTHTLTHTHHQQQQTLNCVIQYANVDNTCAHIDIHRTPFSYICHHARKTKLVPVHKICTEIQTHTHKFCVVISMKSLSQTHAAPMIFSMKRNFPSANEEKHTKITKTTTTTKKKKWKRKQLSEKRTIFNDTFPETNYNNVTLAPIVCRNEISCCEDWALMQCRHVANNVVCMAVAYTISSDEKELFPF